MNGVSVNISQCHVGRNTLETPARCGMASAAPRTHLATVEHAPDAAQGRRAQGGLAGEAVRLGLLAEVVQQLVARALHIPGLALRADSPVSVRSSQYILPQGFPCQGVRVLHLPELALRAVSTIDVRLTQYVPLTYPAQRFFLAAPALASAASLSAVC